MRRGGVKAGYSANQVWLRWVILWTNRKHKRGVPQTGP